MKAYKKWIGTFLVTTMLLLIGLGAVTITVDPYFHYHAPLKYLEYPINNERYQNDGIAKNFEYDAMITGTSMTQNFKATEFDELFGVNSVKLPYPGAFFKEINQAVERAIRANPNLKIVIRSLDSRWLMKDKDEYAYEGYPSYLYDDCLLNDVNYFFNKSILLEVTWQVKAYTESGEKTTTFDDFEMICDLNNYGDILHYTGDINSKILECMHSGEHRLTKENYEEYCDKVYEFYTMYDYDALFEE